MENYETLMKETEEDANKWRNIPFCRLKELILKYLKYPKRSIDLMQFLSKYQEFSQKQKKIILKLEGNYKRFQIVKAILSEKNKAGSNTLI